MNIIGIIYAATFTLVVVGGLLCAIWINWHYPEHMALIARAEQQHHALMDGDDDIGTYGAYPPAKLD